MIHHGPRLKAANLLASPRFDAVLSKHVEDDSLPAFETLSRAEGIDYARSLVSSR